jgi:hypothetical protein
MHHKSYKRFPKQSTNQYSPSTANTSVQRLALPTCLHINTQFQECIVFDTGQDELRDVHFAAASLLLSSRYLVFLVLGESAFERGVHCVFPMGWRMTSDQDPNRRNVLDLKETCYLDWSWSWRSGRDSRCYGRVDLRSHSWSRKLES